MNYKLVVIVIVIVVICFVGAQYYKRLIFNKLLKSLQKGDFAIYFKTLDSLGCKYFYPAFNREYMRLNGNMMKGDEKQVKESFETLLRMRKNKKQELDVAIKAFYYYLDESNADKCKEMLAILEKHGNKEISEECQVIFDIFLCKETKYIETMEEQLKDKSCAGIQRGMFHFMLGLQYGYKSDHKNEVKNLQEAKKELKDTPYAMKIDKLLG